MISGTKEWSVASVNILRGCSHNCRYCYARANAIRFGRVRSAEQWSKPVLREKEVLKQRRPASGTVMFPSTHDVLPEFLEPSLAVISKLLEAGNQVLIVSKPHFQCIKTICNWFGDPQSQRKILFRFTIGARDDRLLSYWEPGAPTFAERFASLQHAYRAGFQTSVSIEPMLDSGHVVDLFQVIEPYVTDTIWLGKMNQVGSRVVAGTDENQVRRIEAGQTDGKIREIYQQLRDEPTVRWKESCKKVLGLELPTHAGLDI